MSTTQTVPNNTSIRKETIKSLITLDKIYANEFQKPGTLTAQLRQAVTTKSFYPSKKVDSILQESLFETKEFGFGEQEFESIQQRIAFILIPENADEAKVNTLLAKANTNNACIYRILSNEPILDENQKYGIQQGLRTFDDYANTQVVRYPKTEENDEKGLTGKIWKDSKGNVQYRRTFYWNTPMNDVDSRNGKVYMSPQIQAELEGASVLAGQTVVVA